MKSYLIACIVVLCACLVVGKPAPSGGQREALSSSINRLIQDLRVHKAAEDRDQKELVKIVLAFSGKLQELQEGIQHIDETEAEEAKAAAKREDVITGSGVKASSKNEGDVPHVVQQVVVKAPEAPKIDNTKFVKLLLTALEKMKNGKGKRKPKKDTGKKDKAQTVKKAKVQEGTRAKKGSEGSDFLERLDKRGQYYDAELDDGFDMFKKRNQKPAKAN